MKGTGTKRNVLVFSLPISFGFGLVFGGVGALETYPESLGSSCAVSFTGIRDLTSNWEVDVDISREPAVCSDRRIRFDDKYHDVSRLVDGGFLGCALIGWVGGPREDIESVQRSTGFDAQQCSHNRKREN